LIFLNYFILICISVILQYWALKPGIGLKISNAMEEAVTSCENSYMTYVYNLIGCEAAGKFIYM
jgi:hypothetical protein